MTSRFEITETILTSCRTRSVGLKSVVLYAQIGLPSRSRSAKPDQHRRGQRGEGSAQFSSGPQPPLPRGTGRGGSRGDFNVFFGFRGQF